MAKSVGTPVICRDCGKTLRGVIGLGTGYHVRRHNRPDGAPCRGYLSTNHRPAPRP